jgi:hypothetical protein
MKPTENVPDSASGNSSNRKLNFLTLFVILKDFILILTIKKSSKDITKDIFYNKIKIKKKIIPIKSPDSPNPKFYPIKNSKESQSIHTYPNQMISIIFSISKTSLKKFLNDFSSLIIIF